MKPLVSVVTPVYNGAVFLESCAGSVSRQSYENWKYTIVDNCSTDDTREIAEAWMALDKRISYVHCDEHVDTVASYNRAFQNVDPQSKYIKVVGADDVLHSSCLEKMVELAEETKVSMVGAYRGNPHTAVIDLMGLRNMGSGSGVVFGSYVLRTSLLGYLHVLGSPSSLLLKTDLVKKRIPFYDESFRHADTEAAYWMLVHSNFAQVREPLIWERLGNESDHSNTIHSFQPEHLRMFVRYGRWLYQRDGYYRELRKQLRGYLFSLYWKRLHGANNDADYRVFQWHAINKIQREDPGDPILYKFRTHAWHLLKVKER